MPARATDYLNPRLWRLARWLRPGAKVSCRAQGEVARQWYGDDEWIPKNAWINGVYRGNAGPSAFDGVEVELVGPTSTVVRVDLRDLRPASVWGFASEAPLERLPLHSFAAAVTFEVVSLIPWPTNQVPFAYTAPNMLGFGAAYIISASEDDETAVTAATKGRYPPPINARDVRVEALAALQRRGGSFGEAVEVAVGDWQFIITLAPALRGSAAEILTTLERVPARS